MALFLQHYEIFCFTCRYQTLLSLPAVFFFFLLHFVCKLTGMTWNIKVTLQVCQLLSIFTIFINYSGFLTIICHKLSSWLWHSHLILPFHIHFNKHAISVNIKYLGADWFKKNELLQNNKNIYAAWWWDSQEATQYFWFADFFITCKKRKKNQQFDLQNYTKNSEFNTLTPEKDN